MITTFLTTVMGWYFVVFALLILLRHKHVESVLTEIASSRSLFFIVAVITLILGLLMVASHNLWVLGWPLVITLFSWLILITALIRLFFPDIALGIQRSLFNKPAKMRILGVVLLLIGLCFLFYVYVKI